MVKWKYHGRSGHFVCLRWKFEKSDKLAVFEQKIEMQDLDTNANLSSTLVGLLVLVFDCQSGSVFTNLKNIFIYI